jgi:hypothetical protein
MFKAIKNWYVELVEVLTELIKILFLNTRRRILVCTVVFLWFLMTGYIGRKFGGFGIAIMFLFPLIPMFGFAIASDKILKRKANAIDPSQFIGRTFLVDPDNKATLSVKWDYDYHGSYYPVKYSIATVLSSKPEHDRKGNRVYIVEYARIIYGKKQNTFTKDLPALEVYRQTKITKKWILKTIQEYLSSRKII